MNETQIDYSDLLTKLRIFSNFGVNVKKYWDIASPEQKSQMLSSIVLYPPSYQDSHLLNMAVSPLYKACKDISNQKYRNGEACWTRTSDMLLKRQLLYRLS